MLNATNKNTLKSIVVLFVLLCILMSFRTTAEKTSKMAMTNRNSASFREVYLRIGKFS